MESVSSDGSVAPVERKVEHQYMMSEKKVDTDTGETVQEGEVDEVAPVQRGVEHQFLKVDAKISPATEAALKSDNSKKSCG
jgi:hypothetical protein